MNSVTRRVELGLLRSVFGRKPVAFSTYNVPKRKEEEWSKVYIITNNFTAGDPVDKKKEKKKQEKKEDAAKKQKTPAPTTDDKGGDKKKTK